MPSGVCQPLHWRLDLLQQTRLSLPSIAVGWGDKGPPRSHGRAGCNAGNQTNTRGPTPMHANETKIQSLIDSARQYVISLFQRPYSWETRDWANLWQDLAELCEEETPRNHFIGSVVTMPSKSVPEGVTKFILIDGQQRLTTLLVLLAVIRDKARRQPWCATQKAVQVV